MTVKIVNEDTMSDRTRQIFAQFEKERGICPTKLRYKKDFNKLTKQKCHFVREMFSPLLYTGHITMTNGERIDYYFFGKELHFRHRYGSYASYIALCSVKTQYNGRSRTTDVIIEEVNLDEEERFDEDEIQGEQAGVVLSKVFGQLKDEIGITPFSLHNIQKGETKILDNPKLIRTSLKTAKGEIVLPNKKKLGYSISPAYIHFYSIADGIEGEALFFAEAWPWDDAIDLYYEGAKEPRGRICTDKDPGIPYLLSDEGKYKAPDFYNRYKKDQQ